MQHQNILEPSLQMRGQSPVNCPDSDVKEWGLNIRHSLYDEWPNGLIPLLDVVNKCKSIKDIGIYNDRFGLKEKRIDSCGVSLSLDILKYIIR